LFVALPRYLEYAITFTTWAEESQVPISPQESAPTDMFSNQRKPFVSCGLPMILVLVVLGSFRATRAAVLFRNRDAY
jgi:hypothetical protein